MEKYSDKPLAAIDFEVITRIWVSKLPFWIGNYCVKKSEHSYLSIQVTPPVYIAMLFSYVVSLMVLSHISASHKMNKKRTVHFLQAKCKKSAKKQPRSF